MATPTPTPTQDEVDSFQAFFSVLRDLEYVYGDGDTDYTWACDAVWYMLGVPSDWTAAAGPFMGRTPKELEMMSFAVRATEDAIPGWTDVGALHPLNTRVCIDEVNYAVTCALQDQVEVV